MEVRASKDILLRLIAKGIDKIPYELTAPFTIWEKQLYKTQQKYNLGMSLKEDPRLAAMKT